MTHNRHINNVAVFCGSRTGTHSHFLEEAEKLGSLLADEYYTLVYGSGNSGLMGATANGSLKNSGTVIGINVHILHSAQGRAANGVIEESFENMLGRKGKMLEICNAYVVMPGGLGTLDEFAEVAVENDVMKYFDENGIIKPVILINPKMEDLDGEGFYDNMLRQIKTCLKMGFANAYVGRFYTDVPDAESAIHLIKLLNKQGPVKIASENYHPLVNKDLKKEWDRYLKTRQYIVPSINKDTSKPADLSNEPK